MKRKSDFTFKFKEEDEIQRYIDGETPIFGTDDETFPFKGRKIRCPWCGKMILPEESKKAEFKEYIGESSKVIQSGFPTGVRVDQVSRKYKVTEKYLCGDCYAKYLESQKVINKKNKNRRTFFYCLGFGAFAIVAYLALTDVISESWLFIMIIPFLLIVLDLLRGE